MTEIDEIIGNTLADDVPDSLENPTDPDLANAANEPIDPAVESLNAAVAASLVASKFEQEVAASNAILDALMARIGDVDKQSPYMNIFIYGPPGVGKSVFLGTADDNLIIDVEDGAKSIKNHPELINKPGKAQTLEYKSVYQVEMLIEQLGKSPSPLDKFKVLSVDSFNSLAERALRDHVEHESKSDASRNPYLPLGPDYNINTQHMKKLATDMHDLERHIVFLAHSKEIKDDSTGKILIRPDLTPKLAGAIAGLFDLVGYLTADVSPDGTLSNRRLQVQPTDKVLAKTRIGGLPSIIENPTFGMLLDAYRKSDN